MCKSITRGAGLAALLVLAAVVLAIAQQGAPEVTYQDLLDGLKDPTRWLTYSGDYSGQRHSPLTQITPENARHLAAQWTFQTETTARGRGFEATPLILDGVLYVTGPNNYAWALDARTGKMFWRYRRDLPANLTYGASAPVNRGFGILGDKLFMVTLDAHLLALDIRTGTVVWDVVLADYRIGYSATMAPLVVKDKVIVGISGGEYATRGFLDAYDPQTGTPRLALLHRAGRRRAGQRNLAGVHRRADARRRRHLGHRQLRSGAEHALLGHRQPQSRLLRRGSQGRQPLHRVAGRARCRHRQAEVALPVHAARHPRLGLEPRAGAGGSHDRRPARRKSFSSRTGTGSSTRWTASPGRCCSASRSPTPPGRGSSAPTVIPWCSTTAARDAFRIMHGGTNFMPPSFDPALRLFFVTARETCATYTPEKQVIVPAAARRWARSCAMRPRPTARCGRSTRQPGSGAGSSSTGRRRFAGVLSTASGAGIRRRQRRELHGIRLPQREEPVALPDRFGNLGRVADDLHARRPPARDHRGRLDNHRIRAAGELISWRRRLRMANTLHHRRATTWGIRMAEVLVKFATVVREKTGSGIRRRLAGRRARTVSGRDGSNSLRWMAAHRFDRRVKQRNRTEPTRFIGPPVSASCSWKGR